MLLNVSSDLTRLIDVIAENLGNSSQEVLPIRICIPLLGSPGWGDIHPKVWMVFCSDPLFLQCDTHTKDVLHFVYSLRTILRRYSHGCASVGLPPYMSVDSWGGAGWLNKLSWLFDASVTLVGFSGERKGLFTTLRLANKFQSRGQTHHCRLHSLLITDLSMSIRYQLPKVYSQLATGRRLYEESRQCTVRVVGEKTIWRSNVPRNGLCSKRTT